jgi:hypothetical protein
VASRVRIRGRAGQVRSVLPRRQFHRLPRVFCRLRDAGRARCSRLVLLVARVVPPVHTNMVLAEAKCLVAFEVAVGAGLVGGLA